MATLSVSKTEPESSNLSSPAKLCASLQRAELEV